MVILQHAYNQDNLISLKTRCERGFKIGVTKQKFSGWQIDRPISVEIAGRIIEMRQTTKAVKQPSIEWIDANTYIDISTGEIKTAERSVSRGDKMSRAQLRKTFHKMRGIANTNFSGAENESMVTLTYHENMRDPERLYYDLQKFTASLKRRVGDIKYLTAVEPQGRGAWHAHILLKQLEDTRLISERQIIAIWPHGYIIDVEPLNDISNVGAYLTAYLSNVPQEEGAHGADVGKKGVKKGQRLIMYPRGIHIFRASRNCDKPLTIKISPMSDQHRAITLASDAHYQTKLDIYAETDQDHQRYLLNSLSQQQRIVNNPDIMAVVATNDRATLREIVERH